MPRKTANLRPANHAMATDNPSLYMDGTYSVWPVNGRLVQNSFQKRWGYSTYRSIGSPIYDIALFQLADGTRYTMALTASDLISIETATGKTWTYRTETHTTGVIASVSGTGVEGTAPAWVTGGIAANDYFIVDSDHTSDEEPDTNWRKISSVTDADTLVLSSAYGSTPTGTYKIRKVYTVPDNERWAWAVVKDKFCFTNGNTNVQYFDKDVTYATSVDSTNAVKARYCIEFANRLFLGDHYSAGIRVPNGIKWSKEGDPTNWTDSTAGELDLAETEDYLTGLGKVGGNLVIYKKDNILIYGRTGVSTNPIQRISDRRGIGCAAPYSIVEFLGTNAFIGRDDFYMIDGDMPVSIGEKVRNTFFTTVGATEIKNVWGSHNPQLSEVMWTANTSSGKYSFVYNYRYQEWYIYSWADDITAHGRGVA